MRFDNGSTAVVPAVTTRKDLTRTQTDDESDDDESDEDDDEVVSAHHFPIGSRCTLATTAVARLRWVQVPTGAHTPHLTKRKARRCTIVELKPAAIVVKWLTGDGTVSARVRVTLFISS